jgi:membrane protein implicated in regulation of membrane protease activity
MTWLIFWIFIIISTLIAEIATVGLVSLWFTVGGICALICNLLKLSVVIQWVVFIVVSVLGLLLFRSFWVNKMKKEIVPTNADANIGKEVIVTEDIDNLLFKGEVKVNGQLWSAQSLDGEKIDKNSKVVIRKIEGNKVFVEKV